MGTFPDDVDEGLLQGLGGLMESVDLVEEWSSEERLEYREGPFSLVWGLV